MLEDYPSAALRHHHDAADLLAAGRLDNAFYLAGYVVECTMKALLEKAGHNAKTYGHELDDMQLAALSFVAEFSVRHARYRPTVGPAVQGWRPEMRYCPTGSTAPADAEQAIADGELILGDVLAPMMLDGLIGEVAT